MADKIVVKIRPSELDTWLRCPEQLRTKRFGEVDDPGSDATLTGTATHASIEDTLLGATPDEAIMRGLGVLRDEWDSVNHINTQRLSTAEGHMMNCYTTWYEQVYPTLGYPSAIEEKFKLPIHETNDYEVVLTGTPDAVFDDEVVDWKTAKDFQMYSLIHPAKGIEKKKWAVQPTAYTYAMTQLRAEAVHDFTFVALHRTQPLTMSLPVTRGPADWAFMLEQAKQLAHQIFLHDYEQPWQRNNQSHLCSEKWCANWSNCVGTFVELPTTRVSHPS